MLRRLREWHRPTFAGQELFSDRSIHIVSGVGRGGGVGGSRGGARGGGARSGGAIRKKETMRTTSLPSSQTLGWEYSKTSKNKGTFGYAYARSPIDPLTAAALEERKGEPLYSWYCSAKRRARADATRQVRRLVFAKVQRVTPQPGGTVGASKVSSTTTPTGNTAATTKRQVEPLLFPSFLDENTYLDLCLFVQQLESRGRATLSEVSPWSFSLVPYELYRTLKQESDTNSAFQGNSGIGGEFAPSSSETVTECRKRTVECSSLTREQLTERLFYADALPKVEKSKFTNILETSTPNMFFQWHPRFVDNIEIFGRKLDCIVGSEMLTAYDILAAPRYRQHSEKEISTPPPPDGTDQANVEQQEEGGFFVEEDLREILDSANCTLLSAASTASRQLSGTLVLVDEQKGLNFSGRQWSSILKYSKEVNPHPQGGGPATNNGPVTDDSSSRLLTAVERSFEEGFVSLLTQRSQFLGTSFTTAAPQSGENGGKEQLRSIVEQTLPLPQLALLEALRQSGREYRTPFEQQYFAATGKKHDQFHSLPLLECLRPFLHWRKVPLLASDGEEATSSGVTASSSSKTGSVSASSVAVVECSDFEVSLCFAWRCSNSFEVSDGYTPKLVTEFTETTLVRLNVPEYTIEILSGPRTAALNFPKGEQPPETVQQNGFVSHLLKTCVADFLRGFAEFTCRGKSLVGDSASGYNLAAWRSAALSCFFPCPPTTSVRLLLDPRQDRWMDNDKVARTLSNPRAALMATEPALSPSELVGTLPPINSSGEGRLSSTLPFVKCVLPRNVKVSSQSSAGNSYVKVGTTVLVALCLSQADQAAVLAAVERFSSTVEFPPAINRQGLAILPPAAYPDSDTLETVGIPQTLESTLAYFPAGLSWEAVWCVWHRDRRVLSVHCMQHENSSAPSLAPTGRLSSAPQSAAAELIAGALDDRGLTTAGHDLPVHVHGLESLSQPHPLDYGPITGPVPIFRRSNFLGFLGGEGRENGAQPGHEGNTRRGQPAEVIPITVELLPMFTELDRVRFRE